MKRCRAPESVRRSHAPIVAIGLLGILAGTPDVRGQERGATFLGGGDDVAWMLNSAPDPGDSSGSYVIQPRIFRPIPGIASPPWLVTPMLTGHAARITASRTRLYVEFSDHSLASIDALGSQPIKSVPAGLRLAAWSGDSAADELYVWLERDREQAWKTATATQPGLPGIWKFDAKGWSRLSSTPPDADAATSSWMAARNGHVLLAWAGPLPAGSRPAVDDWPLRGLTEIRTAEWSSTVWSPSAALPIPPQPGEFWLGWGPTGPAALTVAIASDAATLTLAIRDNDGWHAAGPILSGDAPLHPRPGHIEATVALGKLAIIATDPAGRPQLGWAAIADKPTITWDIGALGLTRDPDFWAIWLERASFLLALLFIFMFRGERFAAFLAPPPAHLTLASPALRGIAAMIDYLPGIIVAVLVWFPEISEFVRQSSALERLDPMQLRIFAQAIDFGPRLTACAAYSLWCFVWEAAMGTTPGKYILGLRVADVTGSRPQRRQVVIRNVIRLAETALPWIGVTSLFFMLVGSRKRQRIGDLFAGTLVVSLALAVEMPPRPPEGDSTDPADPSSRDRRPRGL